MEKSNEIMRMMAQLILSQPQQAPNVIVHSTTPACVPVMTTIRDPRSNQLDTLQQQLSTLIELQSRPLAQPAQVIPNRVSVSLSEVLSRSLALVLHNSRMLGKKERVTLSDTLSMGSYQLPQGDLGIAEIVIFLMVAVSQLSKNEQEAFFVSMFSLYPALHRFIPSSF